MAAIPTAAGRLEEIVAMTCLPEADAEPRPAPGCSGSTCGRSRCAHPEVAGVRQKFDERWRETISSLVRDGQEAGEFGPVDPTTSPSLLSALLDGLAVQIALEDPSVDAGRAFELSMRFAAGQLGFDWQPRRAQAGAGHASRKAADREVPRWPVDGSSWSR